MAANLQEGRVYTVVIKSAVLLGTNRQVGWIVSGTLNDRGLVLTAGPGWGGSYLPKGTEALVALGWEHAWLM